MRLQTLLLAGVIAVASTTSPVAGAGAPPFTFESARVTIDGTSNVHEWTASTSDVRLTAVETNGLAPSAPAEQLLQPGALTGLDVTIPAVSLKSPKDGIDKNMHKALKVQQHPEIRFHLRSLTHTAGDAYQALGTLTIAGVEKDTTLNLQVVRKGAQLGVTGTTDVLMTDFGVAPPKALMGMVRANPKVVITLEVVLAGPVS